LFQPVGSGSPPWLKTFVCSPQAEIARIQRFLANPAGSRPGTNNQSRETPDVGPRGYER